MRHLILCLSLYLAASPSLELGEALYEQYVKYEALSINHRGQHIMGDILRIKHEICKKQGALRYVLLTGPAGPMDMCDHGGDPTPESGYAK